MIRFIVIWFAQLVSSIGTLLTSFCLGLYIYKESQAVSEFSLLMFFNIVPAVLFSFYSGTLVDRYSKKKLVIYSDVFSGCMSMLLLFLFHFFSQSPPHWILYAYAFLTGCANAIQHPSYSAWATTMIDKKDYGRLGGLIKLGEGIPYLISPVIGGILISSTNISNVILVDLCTFLIAISIILTVKTKVFASHQEEEGKPKSFLKESAEGWNFIKTRKALLFLLLFTPFIVFTESWVVALFQPYMLSTVSESELGGILSIGGTGMVVGGILMSIWGGPKRQIFNVLGFIFLQTILVGIIAILELTPFTGTVLAFGYFLCIPFLSASNQAIWRSKVPYKLQGRVFSIQRGVESCASPMAFLTAGFVVDYLMRPLVATQSTLIQTGTFTHTILNKPGAAIAILFLGIFAVNTVVLFIAFCIPYVRRVDLTLPDQAISQTPQENVEDKPNPELMHRVLEENNLKLSEEF